MLQNHTYENIVQYAELFNSEKGVNKEAFEELFTLLNIDEECTNINVPKLKFNDVTSQ